MAKIREVDPAPITVMPNPAGPSAPAPKCIASLQPDGRITVTFLVDVTEASRIVRRAAGMDLSRYMWENILNRAVQDHVY